MEQRMKEAAELVNQGVDPSFKDKHGRRAVHYAASKGHTHILQYLSSRGADLDAEDSTGRAPVHYASTWGHVDAVKFLISKRVWLDAMDGDDDTALHLACRRGHTAVVAALLNAGAKPGLLNKRALTPCGEALMAEELSTAELVAGRGGALSGGGKGFTLLHALAGMGKAVPLGWLLQAGGGSSLVGNASNSERLTPLHAAAIGGNTACAELLLQHGADATACDSEGRTPAQLLTIPPEGAPEHQYATKLQLLLSAPAGMKGRPPSGAVGATVAAAGAEHAAGSERKGQSVAEEAALAKEKRMKQVDVLARLGDAELQHLEAAQRKAVLQVRSVGQVLECYEAMLAVRRDEAFREAASLPEVLAAIEDVKRTGSLQPYLGDSQIMSVMGKLRKLQGIFRTNGGMKVSLEELLQEVDPEEEQRRLATLRGSLQAARAEAAVTMFGELAAPPGLPDTSMQESAAAADSVGTSEVEPTSGNATKVMLQTVGRELLGQFAQAAAVAVVLLFVLWITNRLPWQQADWLEARLREHPPPAQPFTQPAPEAQPVVAGDWRGSHPFPGDEL